MQNGVLFAYIYECKFLYIRMRNVI